MAVRANIGAAQQDIQEAMRIVLRRRVKIVIQPPPWSRLRTRGHGIKKGFVDNLNWFHKIILCRLLPRKAVNFS